jgi:hypothetical protein
VKTDAYVFAFLRPDGQWGAVADSTKRLIVTLNPLLAFAFATVLERRTGATVAWVKRNPTEIAELITSAHVSAQRIEPYVTFIESEDCCKDPEDTVWRAVDMANAVPLDSAGDAAARCLPREVRA